MKAYSFHLVSNSSWPLTTSISVLSFLLGNLLLIQNKLGGELLTLCSLIGLSLSLIFWFYDIIIEGTFIGDHTTQVQNSLNIGFILFVISEICVFFSLFYSYFFHSLVPSIELGSLWPPIGIITLDSYSVPLLNTLILLISGFTITASHNFILSPNMTNSFYRGRTYLLITLILGILFTALQGFEYWNAPFTITDSIFGSSFFILTGCHALHILVGTTLLIISLIRYSLSHFSSSHHMLFSFSAIYWHFLDLFWLLIFFALYIY